MKKLILLSLFAIYSIYSFADFEKVCVITNTGSTGQACTPSDLGFVSPCQNVPFYVNSDIPPGYATIAKIEWFVNNVSVKITTNPTDRGLNWVIKENNTNVYCKITYKKQNGDLSIEYSSNTFVPSVRQLNFQSITTSIINPNYGCTNPITYNLNTYNCTGSFCDAVYSVNQFEITWTAPSGWSQSSISSNGSSVTFIPDASTGGNITATIILPCGYTEIKTYTVYRGTEQPSIPNSNTYTLCNSTGNFPINSICGSISYTYTIIGSSGITFSANGLQTITTTSTAPIINLSGSSTAFVYKVKANFINNISSSEISADLYYGTTPIDFVSFLNPSSGEGYWCSSAYGNTFALSPSLPNVSYEANYYHGRA